MYTYTKFDGGIDVYYNHNYVGSAYGAKTPTQALKIILEK